MKRFHVHLGVPDLSASIRFYSDLFGMPPSVAKPDYAKWMLDDPRVNFAISQRGARTGLNHLGLQADSAEELAALPEINPLSVEEVKQITAIGDNTGCMPLKGASTRHLGQNPRADEWPLREELSEVAKHWGLNPEWSW